MTDDRRTRTTALALALVVTLAIFSGVVQLSSPTHAPSLLAQAAVALDA